MSPNRLGSHDSLDYAAPATPSGRSAVILVAVDLICSFLSLAAAISMGWAARLPVSNQALLGFGVLLWGVVLILTMGTLPFRWTDPHRVSKRGEGHRRPLFRIWPVLLLLLTIVLLRFQVPRRLMIAVNRPAMDAWVKNVLAAPPKASFTSARVGMFQVTNLESIPGGVRFFVAGCGFFRHTGGFAYSPNGPPKPCGAPQDTYTPIGGGWYIREYDGG